MPSPVRDAVRASLSRLLARPGRGSPTPYERSVEARSVEFFQLRRARAEWQLTRGLTGMIAGTAAWLSAVLTVVEGPVAGAVVATASVPAVVPFVRAHRRLVRTPPPQPPAGAVPRPPAGGAGAPAVARVERAAAALDALLAIVDDDVVRLTALTAAVEAEEAVRRLAARVSAVEAAAAIGGAPGSAAAAGLPPLMFRLDGGVQAYERFAATLTDLVCAGPMGLDEPAATARLDAAAVDLQARAHGLRVAAGS